MDNQEGAKEKEEGKKGGKKTSQDKETCVACEVRVKKRKKEILGDLGLFSYKSFSHCYLALQYSN